jgi:DNA-binding transcriptional MerR regulator
MTMAPEKESSLRSIDLIQPLGRLEVGVGQAARLCGISARQLIRWTDIGYIQYKRRRRNRVYDYAAIEKACLVKQARDKGYNIEQAVKLAELFLARRARKQAKLEATPVEALQRLIMARTDRLEQLARRIRGNLGNVIIFLESKPYQVFTASQIGTQLGLSAELVQEELQTLERNCFIDKIHYPRADVYRHIPPRRSI